MHTGMGGRLSVLVCVPVLLHCSRSVFNGLDECGVGAEALEGPFYVAMVGGFKLAHAVGVEEAVECVVEFFEGCLSQEQLA